MIVVLSWVLAVAVAIPLGMFVLECVASLAYRNPRVSAEPGRLAVLIPAHNEELVLEATLNALTGQLGAGDRIVVVADNCSDATADIARAAGCVTLERFDQTNRGKGFALAHGLDHLSSDPPDVVVIVDADCDVTDGSLQLLNRAAMQYPKPVQARYLLSAPPGASLPIKVSEFAVLVKNLVRCKGAAAMGIGVPLLGSGMAFRWADLADVSLASGEIVEDMKLGIELACEGRGALYLESAQVNSFLPSTNEALASQRERWEHGHMGMIQAFSPPLLKAALAKRSLSIFGFLLDLIIPPLSLLLMFTVAVFIGFTLLNWFVSVGGAMALVSSLFGSVLVCVGLIWLLLGRDILRPSEFLTIPLYILSKLGIYSGFMKGKQTEWRRTDRE